MKNKKKNKGLKPSSYEILSKLAAADKELEALIDKELSPEEEDKELSRICEEAEKELNALALKDPAEATQIFAASPYFVEDIDPKEEVYLGEHVIVYKWKAKELDTPEKRAAYVREVNRPLE